MTEDDQANALAEMSWLVQSGFYNDQDVREIIEQEMFAPGEIQPDWLADEVAKAFNARNADEQTWPAETDCDRLDDLFAKLEDEHLVALQNAGLTQADGVSDAVEEYMEAGGEESGLRGYCFYHAQDLCHAIESGDLYLTFGDFDENEASAFNIARLVQRQAQAMGFKVIWDESIETRIQLTGLKWQRRVDA